MNKLYIALELIKLLNERKSISTGTIAEYFNVNIRTAQRYVKELSYLNSVVHDVHSNTYSFLEDYKIKETILNNSEIAFISALIENAKKSLKPKSARFLDQISKNVFKKQSSSKSHVILSGQSIDFSKVSTAHSKLDIHIYEKNVIKLHYYKKNKDYEVSPYKIVLNDGFWYLVCGTEGKFKTLLLDYISNIRPVITAEFVHPSTNFDIILSQAQNVWFEDKEREIVKVRVLENSSIYFKRKICLPAQQIMNENPDGSIDISFEVYNEIDFIMLVKKWLPDIQVIKPEKYKKCLVKLLKDALKINI